MAELLAIGPLPGQRWQKTLPEGQLVRLGRAPQDGWHVPWDPRISREHADLILVAGKLTVRAVKTARNAIVFQAEPKEEFTLATGQSFQIGSTTFKLLEFELVVSAAESITQRTYSHEELASIQFADTDRRIELLSALPGLMARTSSDEELATEIIALLLRALPHAEAVAVVRGDLSDKSGSEKAPLVRYDTRAEVARFCPSRQLIAMTLESDQSIIHIWSEGKDAKYTRTADLDWAFCTPIGKKGAAAWCLYVSGKLGFFGSTRVVSQEDLASDLRFAELLAQFIDATKNVRTLERRQAKMSEFFSPAVVNSLMAENPDDVLTPRECDLSLLFCDLRGFSQKSEQSQHDLHAFLHRVSQALGVMTRSIIKHDGVIADFQGDAALAFWGWPIGLEDGPLTACRTALEIIGEFEQVQEREGHALQGFRIGIGIGFGRAIAGRIGTDEQVKVGVFGPVVNRTARLEGMTKQFGATILLDEDVAEVVRPRLLPTEGRCRRLARVRPLGMDRDFVVHQLLTPTEGSLTDEDISQHEEAVTAIEEGRWQRAKQLLEGLRQPDQPSRFLLNRLAECGFVPPADWDGALAMGSK